ncbi:hypothetical protein ACFQGX_13510 [Nonomuraea dietziae]|uniref:hypothetical protein n=1 Tax=Nonomuraea dietziae TaxID=65515 RepID=UPI00360F2F9A
MTITETPQTAVDRRATLPGPWVEGVSLILGPLLLLAGVLARSGQADFFPGQLAAYAAEPGRMVLSYSLFAAGTVLLWPAVTSLARGIGVTCPGWAGWGVTLVVLGLFGRVFHAGVSHLAFQLVDVLGLEAAQKAVASTYGAFHVFKAVNVFIMGGWIVLAVGAFRARAMGVGRRRGAVRRAGARRRAAAGRAQGQQRPDLRRRPPRPRLRPGPPRRHRPAAGARSQVVGRRADDRPGPRRLPPGRLRLTTVAMDTRARRATSWMVISISFYNCKRFHSKVRKR